MYVRRKTLDINECAIRYLANRSRSIKEMKVHLNKKEYSDIDIKEEIAYLVENKYLNDVDYAFEYINYGFSKGKGLVKIGQELYTKGIDGEVLNKGIYKFEDEESKNIEDVQKEIAYKEAQKTMSKVDVIDSKSIAKLGRRLNSLGHKTDLIYQIMNEYQKEIKDERDFY